MDKLETIFEMQNLLNQDIQRRRGLEGVYSSEEWLQKQTLALLAETAEMLEETNYKWWKNPKEVDEKALKEELVDMLHFYVSMCLSVGMDAEELFRIYLTKNEENFKRQSGLSAKKGYQVEA